jgi:hypothetical protein
MRHRRIILPLLCAVLVPWHAVIAATPLDPSAVNDASQPHGLSTLVRLADADVLPPSASYDLTVRYFLHIARGHALASIELASIGRTDRAVLHSRHALDEAWQELARVLTIEDSQALRQKIAAVNEAIALRLSVPEILAANNALNAFIDTLARGMLRNGISRHRQKLDIIVLLLRQAQREYETAWKGLDLEDQGEYEDGYGFLAIARSELNEIHSDMRVENSAAAAEIQRSVEQMARAWPSLEAPEMPAVSQPVLRALVAAVELNARRFAR